MFYDDFFDPMKQTELFRKILPGFIPLFVFILADELWGIRVGIMVAVITGLAELVISWMKEHKLDRFVLLDTALLVGFSGISILLEDDIFFKLKPGFIELIMVVILGVSAFTKIDIVGAMSQRYMKGVQMNDFQLQLFRKTLRNVFWIFLGHTLLVFYAAFFLSKEMWVFISGGLFYILFGVYFVVEWIRNKVRQKRMNEEEWLPLVDENGRIIGQAPRSECHKGKSLLHPVVHLHVIDRQNRFFLQKRPMNKLIQPGKWDTAVGGHVSVGENLQESLEREAFEEIGLKNFNARLISTYPWKTDVEAELVYLFVTRDCQGIKIEGDEVEEGRFWAINEIESNLNKNVFTPNFEQEFRNLREWYINKV